MDAVPRRIAFFELRGGSRAGSEQVQRRFSAGLVDADFEQEKRGGMHKMMKGRMEVIAKQTSERKHHGGTEVPRRFGGPG